ncbi:MAG: hypothetical protein ACLFRO_07530, partial [Desulfobacterales bacterium]
IPKPFSRVVVDFGEPVSIPAETPEEDFNRICADIEDELNRLTDKVDRICGYTQHLPGSGS